MKLPAVAIVAAFASGIAIGLWPALAGYTVSSRLLLGLFGCALAALLFAALFFYRKCLGLAAGFSAATWFLLGFVGACITNQPKPANYVLNVIDRGQIDLHSPLRWEGVLRNEPAALPWGVAYDLELRHVSYRQSEVATQGGMRITYATHNKGEEPPEAHAGDRITVTTQARMPQIFRDEGAFDRRAFLRTQGIDLTATLRAPELLQIREPAKLSARTQLARLRQKLRDALSGFLPNAPAESAVLRAMLLGDRSFIDRAESRDFQKTGVFHVLVVAGLHVGAFAAFFFWLSRKICLPRIWTAVGIAVCVASYVAIVEQRPPVLRAALMTMLVVTVLFFYRRVELLNSVALAALILLVASPPLLADSSFQLSFLAMFCIGGIALPWLEAHIEPHARGLRGWRDVTRDVSHSPRVAQFRIDLRSIAAWAEPNLPTPVAAHMSQLAVWLLSIFLRVTEIIALTLVLQIGMMPLLARDFHRVTLSGPLANLVAVPLTAVLVPLGFATLFFGLFFPRLALLLAKPLCWLTTLLLYCIHWFAHWRHLSYRVPAPPLWLILFFMGSLLTLAAAFRFTMAKPQIYRRIILALALAAGLAIATHPFPPRIQPGTLELNVLDVGQGDSLFLVSPAGQTLLVDGGGAFADLSHGGEVRGTDPGEEAVSPYLWSRGFKRIDVVALTHAHQDHIGGLTAILENFKVKILWIGREVASPQQEQLEKLALARGTRVIHELRGNHFDFGGAQGEFLWPQIVPSEVAPSAKNDDSLVFHLVFGQRSFLLPGDAEKLSERSLVAENDTGNLRSDVLKIGHHGSKNSTTLDFLGAVQPRLAVISSGEDNPYGHPSPELLERLRHAGIVTLRTDTNGAIHIRTDGDKLEVSCFLACAQINAQLNAQLSSPKPQPPQDQQAREQQ